MRIPPGNVRELGIAVEDQVLLPEQEVIKTVGEVPGHLSHEGRVGMRRDPGKVNDSSRDLGDEKDVEGRQPMRGPHIRS